MKARKDKFVIIDGNALLHRAFHAVPPLTTKDGRLVNAVYGFVTILMRVMKDIKPRYIAATFDLKAPTFRHEEYEEYKATRVKQPDELYDQLEPIKEIVKAFNIPIYEVKGFEADDIIGTVSKKLDSNKEIDTFIVTGDLDTLQLVDDNTFVYTLKRSIADTIIYDESAVKERYQGLLPDQLIDYKALRGDPSDNIPGVKGIGDKTAIELLQIFGSLDGIYKNYQKSNKITPRIKELLKNYKQDAYMSKRLATIVTNVPLEFDLTDNEFTGVNREKVIKIFQDLEFKSLLGKVPDLEEKLKVNNNNLNSAQTEKHRYVLVDTKSKFASFVKKLVKQKIFAFDTETSGLDPWQSELVGISFCWQKGIAYYLPWAEIKSFDLSQLKKIFADKNTSKVGHNLKFDIEVLLQIGWSVGGDFFDTMVAAYLLRPGERQLKLDTLVFGEFGYQMTAIEELIGKRGKEQKSMDQLPAAEIVDYACEDADYTWRLYKSLIKDLTRAGQDKLFDKIEMPLISVLVEMEKNGVKIDRDYLEKFNNKIKRDIEKLAARIYKLCGYEFNIASPKQLKEVLFTKLDIPTEGLKKTKTGISTAASELEKMRGLHPVIDLISEYRELTKLQSTYIEALPKLINPKTGRVHTSFNQTVTATGRLSSSDPNLQNIPIRTNLGRQIRKAFVAESGRVLLSADYSQIELRVAAHLSGDKNMIETFKNYGDIHVTTAAFIFDVPVDEVDSDMRRKAKEVNFGVLYGMGAYGLAQRTGISRSQAQEFIRKYFAKYARMYEYREEILKQAKAKGYVETLFGRKRFLPDINSGVAVVKQAAERAAINMPIQGTSADIIKMAMIEVEKKIKRLYPSSKLILQVHDELVLEVPTKEAKLVAEILKQKMEKVTKLKVPLVVDVKQGRDWQNIEKIL